MDYLFSSESVAEGHPDKVCDQISDAVVDMFLAADPEARVACETLATTNSVVLAGEVRSRVHHEPEDFDRLVRKVVQNIGYEQEGFHWKTLNLLNMIHEQSADIAQGVDETDDKPEGAGDQGIMFGYATTETLEFMPAPIQLAHSALLGLSEAKAAGVRIAQVLGPDAKAQVTVAYENDQPKYIDTIVISAQHLNEHLTSKDVREIVQPLVEMRIDKKLLDAKTKWLVNPTGKFFIGGPDGDTGLTGRKIIVDTYGGAAPHGGGAFSGKDPTKVDRSAAYAARYLAKNVVAAGLAERCTIQLGYAIGVAEPVSLYVTTHGTEHVDAMKIPEVLRQLMDLTPKGIRTHLKLNRPIYQKTSAYGHFGRSPLGGFFPWEEVNLTGALQGAFGG